MLYLKGSASCWLQSSGIFSHIPQPAFNFQCPTFAFARAWHRHLKTIRLLFDPFGSNIRLMTETSVKSLISLCFEGPDFSVSSFVSMI